jgi:PAS domain S-box-containing protein
VPDVHDLEIDPLDLLGGLPDAVVVADASGRIAYVNAAIHDLLGHDPADLLGEPLTALMPERFRALHTAGFDRYLATGRGELVGTTVQIAALRVDGSEITIDLSLSHLGVDAVSAVGGVMVAVLRDASTTVLLERQLQVSRYLSAILRVTSALVDAPDAQTAFAGLLPALCERLDWDTALLWQPGAVGSRLACTAVWHATPGSAEALGRVSRGRAFAYGEGLPGLAWQHRRPVVIESVGADQRFQRADAALADGIGTGVAFPVLHGTTVLAVCELFSVGERPVPVELIEVLSSAGRQIGQFLDGVRVTSELRQVADTLQRSLLPASLPTIPGVQLAARYRAGGDGVTAGGDTYDIVSLPGNRWMILIADVCGMGAEAAAVTALTRHTARASVGVDSRPSHVLAAVNSALLAQQGDQQSRFVTACCLMLRLYTDGVTARIAVAGHPRPLLRSADGSVTEVGPRGRLLGIFPGEQYRESEVELGDDGTLVLYTDGVTGARDHTGSRFGEATLTQVLQDTVGTSAEATVMAIDEAVQHHTGRSTSGDDDLALLAVHATRAPGGRPGG